MPDAPPTPPPPPPVDSNPTPVDPEPPDVPPPDPPVTSPPGAPPPVVTDPGDTPDDGNPPPATPPPASGGTTVNIDLAPLVQVVAEIAIYLFGTGGIPAGAFQNALGTIATAQSEQSVNQRLFHRNLPADLKAIGDKLGIDLTGLAVALQGTLAQGQGKLGADLATHGALVGGGLAQLGKSFERSNELTDLLTKIAAFLSALVAQRSSIPRELGKIQPAFALLPPIGSDDNLMVDLFNTIDGKKTERTKGLVTDNVSSWAELFWEVLRKVFKPVTGPFTEAIVAGVDTVRAPANAINQALFGAIVAGTLQDIDKLDAGRPENVGANSSQILVSLMNRGLNAHLLSVLPELFHPLKHLGFGQMAAFSADLAGFGPIASAIHSPAVNAAIGTPQKYAANARFTPNIPSESELEELVRKRLLSQGDYLFFMGYHGFDEKWAQLKLENLHKDLTLGDISRTVEDTDLGADWILQAVQQRGYSDEDAALIAEGLTQKITRSERGRVVNAAMSLYEQGIGSRADLELELAGLGLRPEKIDLLIRAADMKARNDFITDATKYLITLYDNDVIGEGELEVSLAGVGYRPERIELIVGIQTTRKNGKIAKQETAAAAKEIRRLQAVSIPLYREQFEMGVITADEYRQALRDLGIEDAPAAAIVGLDQLRVNAREGKVKTADAAREKKEILQAAEKALFEQYQKDLLTEGQLAAGLASLGLSAELVNSLVNRERALKVPTPRRYVAPPPEILEIKIAERTRQVIRERYGKGLVSRDVAAAELLATGQDARLNAEDLDLVDARTYKVPKPPRPTPAELAAQRARRDEAIVHYRAGRIDAPALERELVLILGDRPLAVALRELEEARREAAAIAAKKKADERAAADEQKAREKAAKEEAAKRAKESEAERKRQEKEAADAERRRKADEEEAARIRQEALIRRYQVGDLTEEELFIELVNLGVDIDVAGAIVEREAAILFSRRPAAAAAGGA